jgi:hypothetical protein
LMITLWYIHHRKKNHSLEDGTHRLERRRVVKLRANKEFVDRLIVREEANAALLFGTTTP